MTITRISSLGYFGCRVRKSIRTFGRTEVNTTAKRNILFRMKGLIVGHDVI